MDNSTCTFIFKLHNNTLGFNHAVAHFVNGHSPNCTFCDLSGDENFSPETPLHLFFECPMVEPIILQTFCWVLGKNTEENNRITRSDYFGMYRDDNLKKVFIMGIICKVFQKYLWDCKLRHTLPATWHAKRTIKNELEICYSCNNNFRLQMDGSTINIPLNGP